MAFDLLYNANRWRQKRKRLNKLMKKLHTNSIVYVRTIKNVGASHETPEEKIPS